MFNRYNAGYRGGGGLNIDTRSIVFFLIIINIVVFLFTNYSGSGDLLYEQLSLFYFGSESFKIPQLITHMFMHANWGHLFSNMFALYMFGTVLEKVWGPQRFMQFYVITGLGAVLLHMGVQAWEVYSISGTLLPSFEAVETNRSLYILYNTPTVGASGAIFGVLAGFGLLFPNTEMMLLFFPVPIKAKYFISMYILWELYRGIVMTPGDNVAHFAHLGGALFGFIIIKYWNKDRNSLY
jgi:membrane associated rhomboid family serine protease